MANPQLGEVIATTFRSHPDLVADNLAEHTAFYAFMKKNKNTVVGDWGHQIAESVGYDGTGTYKRYRGTELLDIGAQNQIDSALYDPKQANLNITISGRDMAVNMGTPRIHDLLKEKIRLGMTEAANFFSIDLYSDGTASEQIEGLQVLIADDPTTSSTVGGINQSIHSFWRNQTYDFSANSKTAAANLLEGMYSLYRACTFGTNQPDLILLDSNYMDIFENTLHAQQRFADADSGEVGFLTYRFKGAKVIYDGTNSGIASNHGYFINTKHIKLKTYTGRNFTADSERVSVNQDAVTVPVWFMGALTTNGRRFHGVLKD